MANYLAGNIIKLSIYTGANLSGRFRIYTGEEYAELLYDGSVYSMTGVAEVDITALFGDLKNTAGCVNARMITVDDNGDEYAGAPDNTKKCDFVVYGGGISDLLLRKLASAGTDIFEWKLLNNTNNFILSTRTNGKILYIPETEISPLKYYAKGKHVKILAGEDVIATYNNSADTVESIVSIDLETLRRQYFNDHGKIINSYEIQDGNGNYCFTVVITDAAGADYKLKFRNSYGVDELLSIEGELAFTPEFSEVNSFMKYDSVVNKLVENAQRKNFRAIYTANLGVRDINGRMFILDALMSDIAYLQVNGVEYACKLTVDRQIIDSTASEPIPVEVTIGLIDVIDRAGNLLNMAAITGVFDDTFDESFE